MQDIERAATVVVDAGFKIYKQLGPGLLESIYERVLARELQRRGLRVERQKLVSFDYDSLLFKNAFRLDLLIDGSIVVEVKSAEGLHPLHFKQVLTYMKFTDCKLGFLMNFGAANFKGVVKRLVI